MKISSKALILICASLLGGAANAALITGDVTGGGDFIGNVSTADGWLAANPTPFGNEVNVWTLSGNAGDRLTVSVGAYAIEFGMSLYQGVIGAMDLLIPGFDNAAGFGAVGFVAGTSPFGASGTELLDIVLPETAVYSLAVGGEGFDPFGSGGYFYQMSVAHTAAAVPEPGTMVLLGLGLLGVVALRRRQLTT